MQRLLYIARFEYMRNVKRRGFLLTTFGVPLLMIGGFALLIAILIWTTRTEPEQAIGYVDQAGIIQAEAAARLPIADSTEAVPLRPYPDEDTANAALGAAEIDAYVVVPPDYLDTGNIAVYGTAELSDIGRQSLLHTLRGSLLADASPEVVERATTPIATLNHTALDGNRTLEGQDFWLIAMPYLFGLLFLISTFSSASYLLQAIIEEKENRTMEIVVTSVTPHQLIGGKTLGLGALGLTQALVWLLCAALIVGGGTIFLEPLRTFSLPADVLLIALLAFIPGYLLFASLMVGIGAMVTSTQDGQQMASFVSLLGMAPFILNFLIINNPNGPIAVAMTLFPLSAPLALVMRLPLTQIPLWQVIISLSLLVLSTVLVVLAVGRIFRAGMLRYGQPIKVSELVRLLQTRQA